MQLTLSGEGRRSRRREVGPEVELLHWNPSRRRFRGPLRRVPINTRVNNFGDLLGPEIVRGMRRELGLGDRAVRTARLISIGSVMHLAQDGDIVWGAGVNGKIAAEMHSFAALDVRAVRGPLTHAFLRRRGIAEGPLPYGDPALLLGELRPDLRAAPRDIPLTIIPNLNDAAFISGRDVISPRLPLERCLARIARSRLVVGSSLHAVIVAEALGVPARVVRSRREAEFKYADYFLGTGRRDFTIAASVAEAVRLGGEVAPRLDLTGLRAAFPAELWESAAGATTPDSGGTNHQPQVETELDGSAPLRS
jgi:pyruvyltransferase